VSAQVDGINRPYAVWIQQRYVEGVDRTGNRGAVLIDAIGQRLAGLRVPGRPDAEVRDEWDVEAQL
jgi:hypothetical protein